jgi:hypothetical protein
LRPPPLTPRRSLCSSWVGLFFFTAASLFTRASLHRPERLALATSLRVPLHVVAQAMMHVHATRFVSLPESTACSLVWQGTAAFELLLVWLFWLAMYSVAAATPLALAGLVQLLGTALFTTANPGMCASARDICPGSAARYVRTARQLQTLCRLTVVTPTPGGESIRDGQAHAACMAVLTFSEVWSGGARMRSRGCSRRRGRMRQSSAPPSHSSSGACRCRFWCRSWCSTASSSASSAARGGALRWPRARPA